MSMFLNWLKKKGYTEGFMDNENPVKKFNFNTDDQDYAHDHDRVEMELFKTILRKYPEESMDFFQTISQRGDAEISSLLRKLNRGSGPKLSSPPKHPFNQDEVVPSSADVAFGGEN